MPSFKINFGGYGSNASRQLEFDAESSYFALVVLEREVGCGKAVIWQDGQRIGAVSRYGAGFWRIEP